MDIARDHAIPDPVARRHVLVGLRGPTPPQRRLDLVDLHHPCPRHRSSVATPPEQTSGDLVPRDQAVVLQQLLETEEPVLVVGRGEILGGRHLLAREAALVDVPLAEEAGRQRDREGAPLPLVMEHRLVALDLDGPETVHAAQIVPAVHRPAPCDLVTVATPIIASRVTSSASCASVIRSVPAGRSGRTM
jgi:hypothetical protein